jgi:CubicO group peptidase (beta-lactamase class C family)
MGKKHAMQPFPGLALLACLLLAAPAPAQVTLADGKPADVGMSASVLQDGIPLFERAVANDDLRGAVLLVARKGKIVVHAAVGWRNHEKQLPMEKGTLFHVASNTKPVVAAAVLMLVEQGKLDLDAAVSRYLLSFDNEKSRAITVRQLLCHTSGFRIPTIFLNPLVAKSADQPDAPNLRIEVDRFAAIGPKEKPGTTYSYSNPGYNTLGALIEVAAQQPLEAFLTAQVYRPLAMADSFHQDCKGVVERRSCIYRKKDGQWERTYQPGDAPTYPFVRASGGLITTAADYAKFLQMFLNGGSYQRRQLLKPTSIQMATAPQTRSLYSADEQQRRKTFYGFGWQVSAEGVYSHGGSDGTFAWVDPKHEIIGIIFTQSPGGRIPRDEFVRLIAQSVVAKDR